MKQIYIILPLWFFQLPNWIVVLRTMTKALYSSRVGINLCKNELQNTTPAAQISEYMYILLKKIQNHFWSLMYAEFMIVQIKNLLMHAQARASSQ